MEIIAIILLILLAGRLAYNKKNDSDLFRPRPERKVESPKEYIKNVLDSRNRQYEEEKKIALNKERIKKNFL